MANIARPSLIDAKGGLRGLQRTRSAHHRRARPGRQFWKRSGLRLL